MITRVIFIFTLFISIKSALAQERIISNSDAPILKGRYFGQKPPGMKPELFLPDIFMKSKPEWTFSTEFSANWNEFYFTEYDIAGKIDRIMLMNRINDVWTKPEIAPFSGKFSDNDPRLAPNGNTIFWRSQRPLPGDIKPSKHFIIWFAKRTENAWSTPQPVKYGNMYLEAGYPSINKDRMLYFSMLSEENYGETDIFCSKFSYGHCDIPKNLGFRINTEYAEGDMYVAPDDSYLIVTLWNKPGNRGASDLYISFRDSYGRWTELKNMGEPVNTMNNENCPSFSPDGKYFFYMSVDANKEPAKTITYWVDAKIIEELKPNEL